MLPYILPSIDHKNSKNIRGQYLKYFFARKNIIRISALFGKCVRNIKLIKLLISCSDIPEHYISTVTIFIYTRYTIECLFSYLFILSNYIRNFVYIHFLHIFNIKFIAIFTFFIIDFINNTIIKIIKKSIMGIKCFISIIRKIEEKVLLALHYISESFAKKNPWLIMRKLLWVILLYFNRPISPLIFMHFFILHITK